jgi:hypothetical protein
VPFLDVIRFSALPTLIVAEEACTRWYSEVFHENDMHTTRHNVHLVNVKILFSYMPASFVQQVRDALTANQHELQWALSRAEWLTEARAASRDTNEVSPERRRELALEVLGVLAFQTVKRTLPDSPGMSEAMRDSMFRLWVHNDRTLKGHR